MLGLTDATSNAILPPAEVCQSVVSGDCARSAAIAIHAAEGSHRFLERLIGETYHTKHLVTTCRPRRPERRLGAECPTPPLTSEPILTYTSYSKGKPLCDAS